MMDPDHLLPLALVELAPFAAELHDEIVDPDCDIADPAPYDEVEVSEGAHQGQDDLDELGAPGDSPNTALEAIRLGRDWIARDKWVGVGYCLRTIRSLYGVAALYPDAQTAWEESDRKHRTDDPLDIPWGVPVWWVDNASGFGHVALSIGNGRCLSTDYRETGELGVAPISALGPWCGGRLAGWTNDINGVDVWERRPEPWGLDERILHVRRALHRAIENRASQRRIGGLRRWLNDLEARR